MMESDQEIRTMVRKTLELTQANNAMLQAMRRSQRWGTLFRIVYWVVIIGSALGAYYYLQPYIDSLTKTYNSLPHL